MTSLLKMRVEFVALLVFIAAAFATQPATVQEFSNLVCGQSLCGGYTSGGVVREFSTYTSSCNNGTFGYYNTSVTIPTTASYSCSTTSYTCTYGSLLQQQYVQLAFEESTFTTRFAITLRNGSAMVVGYFPGNYMSRRCLTVPDSASVSSLISVSGAIASLVGYLLV